MVGENAKLLEGMGTSLRAIMAISLSIHTKSFHDHVKKLWANHNRLRTREKINKPPKDHSIKLESPLVGP